MYRFIIAILTLSLVYAFSADLNPASAQEAGTREPVATVDGVPIPMSDLEWEMHNLMAKGILPQEDDMGPDSMRSRVIDDLIERELLYQDGVRAGVSVEEESVRAQLDMLKGRFPDHEVFVSALAEMNMTEKDLQRHLERGMLIRKYVDQAFIQTAQVSDQAVEDFYRDNPEVFTRPEQVRASHILRQADMDGPAEEVEKERELLRSLRVRVQEGESFGELAREYSICPSSSQDGDLGFFGRGSMVKEFEDAAFALEEGEISDVVETQFGVHLILLAEKQPEGMVPLEEIKDRLTTHLKQEKGKEALLAHLKNLKETVPITRTME